MKKQLIVDKEGKTTYDGREIHKKDVNSKFLEFVFKNSLKQEIDFVIDDTDPISLLFHRIKEETETGSDFFKKIKSLKDEHEAVIEEKENIENAEVEDRLPF